MNPFLLLFDAEHIGFIYIAFCLIFGLIFGLISIFIILSSSSSSIYNISDAFKDKIKPKLVWRNTRTIHHDLYFVLKPVDPNPSCPQGWKRVLYCRTNLNGLHISRLYPEYSLVQINTPEGLVAYGITSSELQHNSPSNYGLMIKSTIHTSIIMPKPLTAYTLDRMVGPCSTIYTYSSLGVPLTEVLWTINLPHSEDTA